MSGIVLVFRRDGQSVSTAELTGPVAALCRRGPDGSRVIAEANWGLGHLHFWTTPEEVGERQPLQSPDGRWALAFDGRLDNRTELLSRLGGSAGDSDATLVLAALEKWGNEAPSHLVGSFALVAIDALRERVLLARDPLGGRGLCYHLHEDLLVAASSPDAVLAAPEIPQQLDETRLALFLALLEPQDGSTAFAAVRELLPGHTLEVSPSESEDRGYWSPPLTIGLRGATDGFLAEAYLDLLDRSVAATLRANPGQVGILLSGGLDSTPVAALAARSLAATRRPPLVAFTWSFDRFPDCDERSWSREVAARWGIELHEVPCDDALPLTDLDEWPLDPGFPDLGIYRALTMRTLERARHLGIRVVLDGALGDLLFAGCDSWLHEAVRRSGLRKAWAAIRDARRLAGSLRWLPRRLAAPLLPWEARRRRGLRWPWLTDHAVALVGRHLEASPPWPPSCSAAERPERHAALFDPLNSREASNVFSESLLGVELRHPLWSLELVQFMAQVPADQLFLGGTTRPLARRAMEGLLPESVLKRSGKTSFEPLLRAALLGCGQSQIRSGLLARGSPAHRFLKSDFFTAEALAAEGAPGLGLVAWRAFLLNRWCASFHR